MLYGGLIIESGTPDEVRRSTNETLREFVEVSGAVKLLPPGSSAASDPSNDESVTTPGDLA